MFVKDCMRTEVNIVAPDTPVLEADWIMQDKDLPFLLVADRGKPVGVVMRNVFSNLIVHKSIDRDVSEFMDALLNDKVENVMENVILVEPDMPIECAVIIGQEQGIFVFPVMEGGKVTGVATGADFLANSTLIQDQIDNSKSSCILVSCTRSALSDVFDIVSENKASLLSVLHFKSPVADSRQCVVHIGTDNVEDIVQALNKKKLQPVNIDFELVTS